VSDPHTIRISCNAAYSDGRYLFDGTLLIADTAIRPAPGAAAGRYQIVDLHILVPKAKAEELLDGIRAGKVALDIEGMKTTLEQAA
jgi:hypothetical protein